MLSPAGIDFPGANGSAVPRPGSRGRREVGSLYPTFSPPRFQPRMQKETAGRGKCNDRSVGPIRNALPPLRKRSAVAEPFHGASGISTAGVERASGMRNAVKRNSRRGLGEFACQDTRQLAYRFAIKRDARASRTQVPQLSPGIFFQ